MAIIVDSKAAFNFHLTVVVSIPLGCSSIEVNISAGGYKLMGKIWLPITIVVIVFISIAEPCKAAAVVEWVYGRAVNMAGQVEYLEEHAIEYENGRLTAIRTTYYSATFQKIGEQVSDFSHGPQLGSYGFEDERLQYSDGVLVMPDRILMYCKEAPHAETKRKYIPRDSNQIVGQGFNQFIVANLDSLARGDRLTAKLVLPAQMDQYDVRISKSHIQGNRISVRIEVDNWFLRLLTPHVEAEFDLSSGKVLRYQGVSMISDQDGKTVEVAITYDYPRQPLLLSSIFKQATPTSGRN